MSLGAGDRLGDWVVEKALGEGGMGSVYRCHSILADDVHAAVKVLKRSDVIESKDRFVQELRTLSGLHHPAIVRMLGGGRDDGRGLLYLAMELVDGQDLTARLAKGPLSSEEAVTVFGAVADALSYAHQRGVAHRDIKPSNIMLRADGSPVIVDFGIAVAEGHTRMTKAGLVPGTVVYLPPEIFEGNAPDPKSTDAYALGVVLWESITGKIPFDADPSSGEAAQLAQVMGQKLRSEALDPGGKVPTHVREAIRRTTDPSPETRLVDLGAVRDLLTTGRTAVRAKPSRRRSGCAMVAGVLAVLGLGAAVVTTIVAVGAGTWWVSRPGEVAVRGPVDLAATLEEAATALERGDVASARRSAGLALDDHAEDPYANLIYGQALLAGGDGLLARPYLCAAADGGLGARVPGYTTGDLDCERGPGAATPLVDPLALARVDLSAAIIATSARVAQGEAVADAEESDDQMARAPAAPRGSASRPSHSDASGGGAAPPPPPPAAAPIAVAGPPPMEPATRDEPVAPPAMAPAAEAKEEAPMEREADEGGSTSIRQTVTVTEGPLGAELAQAVLARLEAQFERCGERVATANLEGKVRLQLIVAADGEVTLARVVENTTGESGLEPCLAAAARRATFPVTDGPSVVELTLVFPGG